MNENFMKNIFKTTVDGKDHCWLWQGDFNKFGYGVYGNGFAHRISYAIHKGKIPAKWVIDHKCRIRSCVNPDHLDCMPQSENIRRRGINHLGEPDYQETIKDDFTYCRDILIDRFAEIRLGHAEQTVIDLLKISQKHPVLLLHFGRLGRYWNGYLDGYKLKHIWYFMYSVQDLGYRLDDLLKYYKIKKVAEATS